MNKIIIASLSTILILSACSSGSKTSNPPVSTTQKAPVQQEVETITLNKDEVLNAIEDAGMTIEFFDKALLTPEEYNKLGAEPLSYFSGRFRFERESTSGTLVEFKTTKQASQAKGRGFSVHNWYFAGGFSTYWVNKIKDALP